MDHSFRIKPSQSEHLKSILTNVVHERVSGLTLSYSLEKMPKKPPIAKTCIKLVEINIENRGIFCT